MRREACFTVIQPDRLFDKNKNKNKKKHVWHVQCSLGIIQAVFIVLALNCSKHFFMATMLSLILKLRGTSIYIWSGQCQKCLPFSPLFPEFRWGQLCNISLNTNQNLRHQLTWNRGVVVRSSYSSDVWSKKRPTEGLFYMFTIIVPH